MLLNEVPQPRRLRCPEHPEHTRFVREPAPAAVVDEHLQPVQDSSRSQYTCYDCGAPARVLEQLHG